VVRRPVLVDGLLAAVVVVLGQVELRQPWDDGFRAGPMWLDSPVTALAVLPLALRTRAPRLGLLLMVTVNLVPGLLVAHTLLFWGDVVPMLVMVFTVARRDAGAAGRYTWLAWPVVLLSGARIPTFLEPANLLFGTVVYVFAWFAGRLVRRMDERGRALADALARLSQEQSARQAAAVAHERSRIAAEMHDVVSHAVSLMVIQVGAARMELETSGGAPSEVAQLGSAERAGREALDALRRSLGVLRGSLP
jgi:signal transduction histidine kinase